MSRNNLLVLGKLNGAGFAGLDPDRYAWGPEVRDPVAMIVRSQRVDAVPPSVRAVGRAGIGVDKINVAALTRIGIPVFNTPGANALGVAELTMLGMQMAARDGFDAVDWTRGLDQTAADFDAQIERAKGRFAGSELCGKRLLLVGLGHIGALVADLALAFGMDVLGYDTAIGVEGAWRLSPRVKRVHDLTRAVEASDFISLHVPLIDETKGLLGTEQFAAMRPGTVLLNFARPYIVDRTAVIEAVEGGLVRYVTDFPVPELLRHSGMTAFPHLGASTSESEARCSEMIVAQVTDYLEHGIVSNSVNFPTISAPRKTPFRVAVAHWDVVGMIRRLTAVFEEAGLNINRCINESHGDDGPESRVACTLLDLDRPVLDMVIRRLLELDDVLSVRYLPAA